MALVLAALWGQIACRRAWHETRLREAYLPELERMAQRARYDSGLLALLGARLCEGQQFEAAGQVFEKAVGAGDRSLILWRTWAATAAAGGEPEKALAVLKLGAARIPEIAPALRDLLARCQALPPTLQADGPRLAETIYPNGIHLAAAYYTAGSFLNGLAEWRGRRDPAASGFATRERWAKQQPNDPQAQRLWGEALLTNRRPEEAEAILVRAAALAPASPGTHLALADTLARRGQSARAGLEYLACLRLKPNWVPALLGLGQVSLDKKLTRISLDAFAKAARADPRSAAAWIGLGETYYRQRLNMAASLFAYEKAVRLAPARTDFYGKYADALSATGRFAEAERLLHARLEDAPEDSRAHYQLALVLLGNNATPERQQQAEREMREALRLEPAGTGVSGRLGRLLAAGRRFAEAIPLLERALKADPYNLPQLAALARAYQQTGRIQEAKAAQESLQNLAAYLARVNALEDDLYVHPGDVRLHLQLADLYRRGGEREKARFHQQTARMLQRDPERAARGIDILQTTLYGTTPLAARPDESRSHP